MIYRCKECKQLQSVVDSVSQKDCPECGGMCVQISTNHAAELIVNCISGDGKLAPPVSDLLNVIDENPAESLVELIVLRALAVNHPQQLADSATEIADRVSSTDVDRKNGCPNCGEMIQENVAFCPNCGEHVEQEGIEADPVERELIRQLVLLLGYVAGEYDPAAEEILSVINTPEIPERIQETAERALATALLRAPSALTAVDDVVATIDSSPVLERKDHLLLAIALADDEHGRQVRSLAFEESITNHASRLATPLLLAESDPQASESRLQQLVTRKFGLPVGSGQSQPQEIGMSNSLTGFESESVSLSDLQDGARLTELPSLIQTATDADIHPDGRSDLARELGRLNPGLYTSILRELQDADALETATFGTLALGLPAVVEDSPSAVAELTERLTQMIEQAETESTARPAASTLSLLAQQDVEVDVRDALVQYVELCEPNSRETVAPGTGDDEVLERSLRVILSPQLGDETLDELVAAGYLSSESETDVFDHAEITETEEFDL